MPQKGSSGCDRQNNDTYVCKLRTALVPLKAQYTYMEWLISTLLISLDGSKKRIFILSLENVSELAPRDGFSDSQHPQKGSIIT